uniref:CARD domain-containing protein n=1 Tax=Plectus sambesii TaxID=2011161 RepID=A0A914UI06_9BILA
MDMLKQKAIRHNYANLVDCLNPLRVMDHLAHLLSLEEMELIRKSQFTSQEKTRELVAILLRKNEELRPFECFIKALEETDENHKTMAETILKTYTHHNGPGVFKRASITSLSHAEQTEYNLQM